MGEVEILNNSNTLSKEQTVDVPKLRSATRLNIIKVPSWGNKYEVVVDREFVLRAREQTNVFDVNGGRERRFLMRVSDKDDANVVWYFRECKFPDDYLKVVEKGRVTCIVRRQPTKLKPLLHINDANDQPVLRVKGDRKKINFKIQTMEKRKIGGIVAKHLKKCPVREMYYVGFPQTLDLWLKEAVIGVCVLIDVLYHSP